MQTAITMPVLAFLTLAVHSGVAGDWNSIGRVPKNRNVTVHLRNGRNLKGTILEVADEGLQLVPEKSRTPVNIKELTRGFDRTQAVGQSVELTTRSGQIIRGTLQEVGEDRLSVDEARNAIQIGRTEVRRITSRSHWMGALIGLAIGGGGGAIYGARSPGHTATWNQSAADAAAEGGGIFGLVGALGGAVIGIERTIYDSASRNYVFDRLKRFD